MKITFLGAAHEVTGSCTLIETNGKNILVELQVSTKWCRDNDIEDFIDLVAYEFEGELTDYTADEELKTVKFSGNWKTAIDQMKKLALEVSE